MEAPSTIIRIVVVRPGVGVFKTIGAYEIVIERTRGVIAIGRKPFSFISETRACTFLCCY